MLFTDRRQAGEALAAALSEFKGRDDVLVLGIPRGGVVVAAAVAEALGAPLDVIITRKVGAPGQPELAIGAVASGGAIFIDEQIVQMLGVSPRYLEIEVARERLEIERREHLFRQGLPPLSVAGRTIIVVDDGIATGATMLATVQALRSLQPKAQVLAVPVASWQAIERLRNEVDRCVCLAVPEPFLAVGLYYEVFEQTSDEEVMQLLRRQGARHQRDQDKQHPRADEGK